MGLVLVLTLAGCARLGPQQPGQVASTLTILHNNDAESHLLAGPDGFGGADHFVGLVHRLREEAGNRGEPVLVLAAGDDILPGKELNASLLSPEQAGPLLDAIVADLTGYDALLLGNHDFDLGPTITARYLNDMERKIPVPAANLDFSGEPVLAGLADAGRLVKSVVVSPEGHPDMKVGVIGLVTPDLASLSSPGKVGVGRDMAGAVQGEVDQLTGQGVDKIVLVSHLQGIANEVGLAGKLAGVDVIVAGGGHELLANQGARLAPGDEPDPKLPYPLMAKDRDGRDVPVVTAGPYYRYVGRLTLDFDAAGRLVQVRPESGPVRVAGGNDSDADAPDPATVQRVTGPVEKYVATLARNQVGATQVGLDGRWTSLRSGGTNLGDLVADAVLWQAARLAPICGIKPPQAGLVNTGGIRIGRLVPTGPLSEADVYDIIPFPNTVTIFQDVSPERLKDILEHSLSGTANGSGRFPQVAGLTVTWNPAGQARSAATNAAQASPRSAGDGGAGSTPAGSATSGGQGAQDGQSRLGNRVQEIALADGTKIVANGQVVPGAPSITLATIDYLGRGGNGYPMRDLDRNPLPATWQRALRDYIREGLGGTVTAEKYPEGGGGRVRKQER